jgi:hypothetical protein
MIKLNDYTMKLCLSFRDITLPWCELQSSLLLDVFTFFFALQRYTKCCKFFDPSWDASVYDEKKNKSKHTLTLIKLVRNASNRVIKEGRQGEVEWMDL